MHLKVKDLVLRYLSEDEPDLVIDSLSADCPLGVLGGGGSGKTNLIKILSGVEIIEKGEIFIDGNEIGGLKPKERNIALISKDTPLFLNKTARFNLEFPLKKRKEKLNTDELPPVLAAVLDKTVKDLDEKARIDLLLIRARSRKPSVVLIDEPSGFCSDAAYFIERAVQLLDKQKIIMATYDFDLADKFCESFIVLRCGKIIFCGSKEELLLNQDDYIKAFLR